jgi:hypothetical protein
MKDSLNTRVCRKMGIEPKREWVVGTPPKDGASGSVAMTFTPELGFPFNDQVVAEMWLTLKRKGLPKGSLYDEWEAWESVVYPNLMTPEWAGRLLEMLAALGVRFTVRYEAEFHSWTCGSNEGALLWRAGQTLAEAVCRAIDSMEVQP